MRMIRDSPPELARELAAPYESMRKTLKPDLRRKYAVQAPKTPAPTTATSYDLGWLTICPEGAASKNPPRSGGQRSAAKPAKPSVVREGRQRIWRVCPSRRLSRRPRP